MDTLMIEARDLYKSFGDKRVLSGVNLVVPRGISLVIMGGSGVGKSVLLKHLIGLLRPDSGTIRVKGEALGDLSEAELNRVRRCFGMSFQEGALFDSMNVFDNIAFPLRRHTDMSEEQVNERVEECLTMVGLEGIGDRAPSELSGGMRRRVGFARAISLGPEILLFDEPTTGLDPVMTSIIARTIRELTLDNEVTSVTITHDLMAARIIGDRIAMLHGGVIVAEESPEEFMTSTEPVVREFVAAGVDGWNGKETI